MLWDTGTTKAKIDLFRFTKAHTSYRQPGKIKFYSKPNLLKSEFRLGIRQSLMNTIPFAGPFA
jgi:hypothetical protein